MKNVSMWVDRHPKRVSNAPGYPRRRAAAHDIAFALVQALHSPAAGPQFLRAGAAYYRQLYEVNPAKIPADWRDWNPLG